MATKYLYVPAYVDKGWFSVTLTDQGWFFDELTTTGAPPAPIEPTLWLAEENWQPEDEYEVSFGEVVNLVEDAAAVADDPEARIALYDEQPDLVTDEEYVQDQYTEPIGGIETYITPETEPHLEEYAFGEGEIPASVEDTDDSETRPALDGSDDTPSDDAEGEIPQLVEDSLEGIFNPAPDEDHGYEHTDGEIPASVEDAVPDDDPETRPALDGSYEYEDLYEQPFLGEQIAELGLVARSRRMMMVMVPRERV